MQADDRDLNQTFVEGKILKVTNKGLFFTLAGDEHKHSYGPVPWPNLATGAQTAGTAHTHPIANPTVGHRCLVVFMGTGIDTAWCIGVWPPT